MKFFNLFCPGDWLQSIIFLKMNVVEIFLAKRYMVISGIVGHSRQFLDTLWFGWEIFKGE